MIKIGRGKWGLLVLAAAIAAGWLGALPARAAEEDNRYVSYTLRGRLFDPETNKPMGGATLRFVPVDEGGERLETQTSQEGNFVVKGMKPGRYSLEIETMEGEKIRGVSAINMNQDTNEVVLKISDRFTSETSVDLKPERVVAAVEKKSINWKRFWTELGIFVGAGAVAAAGFM